MSKCFCASGRLYDTCCGALHAGAGHATTAEQLMRSRYSAFAVGNADYLLATWDAASRPTEVTLPDDIVWTRLRILDVVAGGEHDDTGTVEFRAHFRRNGEPDSMTERSTFGRDEDGRWRYVAAQ